MHNLSCGDTPSIVMAATIVWPWGALCLRALLSPAQRAHSCWAFASSASSDPSISSRAPHRLLSGSHVSSSESSLYPAQCTRYCRCPRTVRRPTCIQHQHTQCDHSQQPASHDQYAVGRQALTDRLPVFARTIAPTMYSVSFFAEAGSATYRSTAVRRRFLLAASCAQDMLT
jgi:hypothetical protein